VILLDRRGNPIKVSDKAQAALSALNAAGKSTSPINLSTLKIPTSFKSAAAENLPDWISRD